MPISGTTLLTAVAALAAVLLLVLAAGRLARMGGLAPARAGKRLALREALALDARRRLLIVACDDRELLILTGQGADSVVGWLPGPGAMLPPVPGPAA